jgi:hypothetical protein
LPILLAAKALMAQSISGRQRRQKEFLKTLSPQHFATISEISPDRAQGLSG